MAEQQIQALRTILPLRSNRDTSCGLCSNVTKRSYALIASNLATLYTQRDIINRKIFLEDFHG